MTKSGKELIEEGEEMVQKGRSMVEQGSEMDWGETVVVDGHEMKKGEMRKRGREMIQRGESKIERGREMRKYDVVRQAKEDIKTLAQEPKKALNFWTAVGYIPITVAVVVGVSALLILEGITTTWMTYGGLINPLSYVELLFVHSSWENFLASMYFFVPAGVILTYLTNNKKVFEVLAVSHVSAVIATDFALGQAATGTTAAAYGLLAATAVRSAYIGSRKYSSSTRTATPIGIFVISSIGILMIGAVSGGVFHNMPLVIGFVTGGALESLRVVSKTRGTENAEVDESPLSASSR